MPVFPSLALYSDYGVLILRVVMGVIFIAHGYPKLFGKKEKGQGLKIFADWLASMKFPAAWFLAFIAAVVEFVGGILLIVGLFTQITAVLIALEMVVTSFVQVSKMSKTLFGGFELDIILLAAAIALIFLAGDSFSIDTRIFAL